MASSRGLGQGFRRVSQFPHHAFATAALGTRRRLPERRSPIDDGLAYGVPTAAATSLNRDPSVAFLSCPLSRHCFGGLCGARRLRSFCFALAPFRFWLPRSGPPRKAASCLGSRAHSLSGARDKRAERENMCTST